LEDDVKNVLVTGGAGFIGSNFVRTLSAKEPDAKIIVLDALTYAGCRENVDESGNVTLVPGNICDAALLTDLLGSGIDTVIHCAAETHVDRSILGPEAFIETNVMGTFRLLEACRKAWAAAPQNGIPRRFHHVSTDEVYGSLGPDDPPFVETTPYDPSSPYSASKAGADHLVRAYSRTYGLPVTISNCSNNYGPYQYPEKLIPLIILNAMEEKPLPVYGDGKQRRDWLYVEDHCEGIYTILKYGVVGHTYNIGGAEERTNIDIIRLICQKLDISAPLHGGKLHESLIQYVADRPGHDRRYSICFDKLHNKTGWVPSHSLAHGIEKTISWYMSHQTWLAAIRGKGHQAWIQENYGNRGAGQ
jgi:dTDP-glucose 4,6-dehydratase